MRNLLTSIALLAALNIHAKPASQESVENLLAVTKSESMMDSMYGGMEQLMRQSMSQAIGGKPMTAEQRRIIDAMPTKFVSLMREELKWEKMKPLYVQLYRETFDQEEVDGLLAFYASPSGQAFINKMPIVMQKSMEISQSLMQSFMPKMMAAMKDAMEEAKISGQK